MENRIQVKITEEEYKDAYKNQMAAIVSQVEEIVPKNSTVRGRIVGSDGKYYGFIQIKTRIGAFVAKAKARNLFTLIAKLQTKVLRQIVNWREKRAAKKRYLRRKQKFEVIPSE